MFRVLEVLGFGAPRRIGEVKSSSMVVAYLQCTASLSLFSAMTISTRSDIIVNVNVNDYLTY
jgi:hypothetical protein